MRCATREGIARGCARAMALAMALAMARTLRACMPNTAITMALVAISASLVVLGLATVFNLAPVPTQLAGSSSHFRISDDSDQRSFARLSHPRHNRATLTRAQVLAVGGEVLNRTYSNAWNFHDRRTLHEIPELLRAAFIGAEDRSFYQHHGIDWPARVAALTQNLRALRVLRGASTISEQSVRMLYPRPRTMWSRWLEGFNAMRLERRFGKSAVLQFYLNQVPFAANRRGVVQAARYYFDRDLDTLSLAETLTLAVLVRAPSRLDPKRHSGAADGAVQRLALYLHKQGVVDRHALRAQPLNLSSSALEVPAAHAVRYALATDGAAQLVVRTSLHAATQTMADRLLQQRLNELHHRGARHGAVLVVDHQRGAIRAWVSGNAAGATPSAIDAVLTPRQPGSTVKPFVYAMAMRKGWNAATMIEDAPYSQSVGQGQHAYRNYSRVHYGAISMRNALGNSLNVPAVKALATVGTAQMLQQLRRLGVRSLERSAEHYGDGLALGNGEVTLLELAGAYAALANGGVYRPLQLLPDRATTRPLRVIDALDSAIIADILADPNARSLEFGSGGVLSLPNQTAVKTGTSNDHRDAWAIGFDHQHVVAVWMGDLQRRPMNRITGASGPALVMRALFAQLNVHTPARALHKPATLLRLPVCADDGLAVHAKCKRTREEWFSDNNRPRTLKVNARLAAVPRIRQPSAGLRLAIDPRVARADQQYLFALTDIPMHHSVQWFVNDKLIDGCAEQHCLWTLQAGNHTLFAQLRHDPPLSASVPRSRTARVSFLVH